MVDPALIGAGVALLAAAGAVYGYVKRGGSAEVDIDQDGSPDIVLEETDEGGNFEVETTDSLGEVADEKVPSNEAAPPEVREKEDLTDVKGIGPTRADDLEKADFHTADDLYFATDEDITAVHGIGDLTVSQIREDIGSVEGNETGDSTESESSD